MKVFHVTTVLARDSIDTQGFLEPAASEGKKERVWLCTVSALEWAILHIAAHKKTEPENLIVYETIFPRKKLHRVRRGIWYSYQRVPVFHSAPAFNYIDYP